MKARTRTLGLVASLIVVGAAPLATPPGFVITAVPVPVMPQNLQAADLDGDGDVDLAVLSMGHSGSHLTALVNGPGGAFAAGWEANLPPSGYWYPPDLDLADLDVDGDQDLAALIFATASEARLNAGDATFDTVKPLNWVSPKVQHCFGLLDGDAVPDLVSFDDDLNGYISSFKGLGTGSFTYIGATITPQALNDARAELGDVTGDGLLDFVHASKDGLELAPGKAAAGFPAWGQNTKVWADPAVDLALADLNGDGRLDIVVTIPLSGAIEVFYQLPAGGLTGPAPFPGGVKPGLLTVGDMDSDGLLDVVVVNQVGGTISVLHNDGGGVFLTSASYPGGRSLTDIVAADLDGDGDTDLAGTHQRGQVVLLFNQLVP